MDMFRVNSTRDEIINSATYKFFVKKQEETEENFGVKEDVKSDVDCFKELCERFPYASFAVQDNSLEMGEQGWLPKRFLGISNLQNFSSLETFSIAFDVKIFEKAASDPAFMEDFMNFMEHLSGQWPSWTSQCLRDGMQYVAMDVYLTEDGRLSYTVGEYPCPFRAYREYAKNQLIPKDDDIAKRILEAFEKEQQDGLFAMLDKIQENSEELKEQIEEEEKHERYLEKIKVGEYEKTFLYESFAHEL